MNFTKLIAGSTAVLLVSLGFFSCTSDVESRPNYIFKPAPEQGVAAKFGDHEISMQELYSGIENEIYEAEKKVYELKMNRLQALIVERFMKEDPRKEGMTNDEYLEKFILGDATASERDIQKFIDQRGIPQNQINDEMKERISQFLMMEKQKDMIDEWLAKKTSDQPVEVYFERPQRPVFEVEVGDSPYKGRSDAAVTIVEFSDFQCPFCSKGADVMEEVYEKYSDKVRIVFKNFPLPFHQHAHEAAQAALCANDQSRDNFWSMHEQMFSDQEALARSELVSKAQSIGLDVEEFEQCLNSEKFKAQVDQDVEQGKDLGVQSTPTYFVNGMVVNGAQPLSEFSEIIEEALNR